MIAKNLKLLRFSFFIPILILSLLLFFEYDWEISLMGSVVLSIFLNIGLKAKIYYRKINLTFNWIFLLGAIAGVIYFVITHKTNFLAYIVIFFCYILISNLLIEKSMLSHIDYHIKHKLNNSYVDERYKDTEPFKQKVYLRNIRTINAYVIVLGTGVGIFLVISIVYGIDLLTKEEMGDGLGLLGVGLGIIGFLGILIAMENSREKTKFLIKSFYFILEEKHNIDYVNKLEKIDPKIIEFRDIPYLLDLVEREKQREKLKGDLEEIISKITDKELDADDNSKNSINQENRFIRILKVLMNWD
ncbi:hypothetical protein ACQKMI_19690 [Lysinibacillus sp. NPDC097214]|uniref:hypothetical protein n=1 Tax=Lysinibacillus sp. NPDC097214 TaxID=3390584 RepID=UPI003D02883C